MEHWEPIPTKFISDDTELTSSEEFKKVFKVVKDLWDSGTILRGSGYCYGMSDLLRILLIQHNIPCKLVECKITVMKKNPPGLALVGHEGGIPKSLLNPLKPDPDLLDSHVVVITETPIPILIDLSIGHIDSEIPYIIEKVLDLNSNIILDREFKNSRWTYQRKESISVPSIHQESIIDRFKTDKKIKKEITQLKVIIFILLVIGVLNFSRGIYDFHQKYIIKDNGWGPVSSQTGFSNH